MSSVHNNNFHEFSRVYVRIFYVFLFIYFLFRIWGKLSYVSMSFLLTMLLFHLPSLQVGLMRNGHLLAEGPPDAVMKQHSATVSDTLTNALRKKLSSGQYRY